MAEIGTRQSCPNCSRTHDVSVYVTGQKLRCACGISFEVLRADALRKSVLIANTVVPSSNHAPQPPLATQAASPEALAAQVTGMPALPNTAVSRALEIPGYELREVLGRGGMGEVWKARQLSLDRAVAIKVLAAELARDKEFVSRFEKEAAALAALSHPNIIQIIDRGATGDTFFFVMELFEGKSLRELMGERRLTPREGLRLFAQICRALEYAHGRGIVHRDLKPENILVDPQGSVKVVDFGLAGIRRDPKFNLTQTSVAMGTLNYMAPEQRRDARSADERADIYSLGVLLYEMLTGEVPVGRFKLPSEKVSGLDTRVDKIVNKSLEPEPAARYPSVTTLLLEVDALISTAVMPASLAQSEGGLLREGPAHGRFKTRKQKMWTLLAIAFAIATVSKCFRTGPRVHVERSESGSTALVSTGPKLPPDTSHRLPITLREAGGATEVSFEPGEGTLMAHLGEWRAVDGKLVGRVYDRQGKDFAVIEERMLASTDFVIEAVLTVRNKPPAGYALNGTPEAQIQLRSNDGHVYFGATFDDTPCYRLKTDRLDKDTEDFEDDTFVAPVYDRPLRLKLESKDGLLIASAGPDDGKPRELWRTKVRRMDFRGRVALWCQEATCEFSSLRFSGAAQPLQAHAMDDADERPGPVDPPAPEAPQPPEAPATP